MATPRKYHKNSASTSTERMRALRLKRKAAAAIPSVTTKPKKICPKCGERYIRSYYSSNQHNTRYKHDGYACWVFGISQEMAAESAAMDAKRHTDVMVPSVTCPKCGLATVRVVRITGATRYWHEPQGPQRKHRCCIVQEPREPIMVEETV